MVEASAALVRIEVTRVAREVGTEGKLAARRRAGCRGYVEGPHLQSTSMASPDGQVRNIAEVHDRGRASRLSRRSTSDVQGRESSR